ncbi:unnamed protein product [Candidula unifasciata]|uniref:G-protein coupled receptors family 1 profile domain-containing protein n=1 Tax=Candidula unifasciata TaxID=100452 RepID=A0A8S3YX16_9EUPU|nr:unnamed protein product [Candidula unifasciata]
MNNFTDIIFENATYVAMTTSTRRMPLPAFNAQAALNSMLMNFPEYRLAAYINFYGFITEIVVGSVANILTLVVMLGLTHLPICNYMAALALADLSVLLGPCLLRWLLTLNVDPRPSSTVACRLLNFLSYWSFSFSAWILVAMTIDRYIAISFPLRALRLSTPRRARIVVGVLGIVAVLVNFHFLIILDVKTQPGFQDKTCVGYDQYRHFLDVIWPWLDATVYSFLPFTILIVFNFLIIRNHRKSIAITLSMKGSKSSEIPWTMSYTYRKITITLVVVAFSFIFMTAPRVILHIIRPVVFNFKPTPNKTDFQILAQYTLAASIVNVLLYGNHSINFFLYVLTGRKFREQLMNTLGCCRNRRLRRVQSVPVNCSSTETNTSSLRSNRSTEDFQSRETIPTGNRDIFTPQLSLPTLYDTTSKSSFRSSKCKTRRQC